MYKELREINLVKEENQATVNIVEFCDDCGEVRVEVNFSCPDYDICYEPEDENYDETVALYKADGFYEKGKS